MECLAPMVYEGDCDLIAVGFTLLYAPGPGFLTRSSTAHLFRPVIVNAGAAESPSLDLIVYTFGARNIIINIMSLKLFNFILQVKSK